MIRKLEQLQITIEPIDYVPFHTSDKLLKFKVVVNEKPYFYQKVITPDDLDSLFERVFDYAKRTLREVINGEIEAELKRITERSESV